MAAVAGPPAAPVAGPEVQSVSFDPNDPAYDSNISGVFASLAINAGIGATCLLTFFVLHALLPPNHLRSKLGHVTIPPPLLPTRGLGRIFGWIGVVMGTSDAWLLHSAGLDALVLQKCQALSIQLFLPIALIGCCMLIPLQISEAYDNNDKSFSRMTMANVDPSSRLMWGHWVLVFAFLGWTMLLLEFHFRQFVSLRHFYLCGGESFNHWRELHLAEADGVTARTTSRLGALVEGAHMEGILQMMETEEPEPPKGWWRKQLVSLTSWTGGGSATDVMELARHLTSDKDDTVLLRRLRGEPQPPGAPAALGAASVPISSIGSSFFDDGVPDVEVGGGDQAGPGGQQQQQQQQQQEQGERGWFGWLPQLGWGRPREDADQQQGVGGGGGAAGQQAEIQLQPLGVAAARLLRPLMSMRPVSALEEEANLVNFMAGARRGDAQKGLRPPKWWTSVDVVTTKDGRLRRMTEDERAATRGHRMLLAKPSVRYRKTVNTFDIVGRPVAVNAQAYAVLVTNVPQPVYPEFHQGSQSLGAGPCGRPRVKHGNSEGRERWLGDRYRRLAQAAREDAAANAEHTAGIYSGRMGAAAVAAAGALAALQSAESGPLSDALDAARRASKMLERLGVSGRAGQVLERLDISSRAGQLLERLDIAGRAGQLLRRLMPGRERPSPAPSSSGSLGGLDTPPRPAADQEWPPLTPGDGASRAGHAPLRDLQLKQRGGRLVPAVVLSTPMPELAKPASTVRSPAAAVRAAQLWSVARAAMRDGRLRRLLRSERYSVVSAVFGALFPDDFDRVVPVFNFRETDVLMRKWDVRLGELEAAEHAAQHSGRRPERWIGLRRVDAIDWLRDEVSRLEREVLLARERALVYNSSPSSFVLFRSQKAAAIAASCTIHPLRKQLFKASGERGTLWGWLWALWFTHAQRVVRGWMVAPLIIAMLIVPVSMLSSAATQLNSTLCSPNNTKGRWASYCDNNGSSFIYSILKGALTGFMPAMMIQLWQGLVLPRLIFYAAQSEARHYSLSALDQRMGSIYFMWSLINFFLGGVLGSTALARVPDFVSKPFETPQLLGYALPASAKFFFTYLVLRTLTVMPSRFLMMVQPGASATSLKSALLSAVSKRLLPPEEEEALPERERFTRTAIPSPRYAIELGGNTCLVMLVSLAYAAVCPLIPLFAVAYFCLEWLYWRYSFIYNFQRKYESGGTAFVFFADRVMLSAAVMVVFTGCVMIIKRAWAQATLLWVFGLVALYAFHQRTRSRYVLGLREMPLLVAQIAPRARVPPTAYVPPPLQQNGFGWHPEHLAVWEGSGLPNYSV
ncbi:ERD4-related membrane protein [Raphidocelis subcapitata]|uniref:ERD4-related membrane protein n=1 Tax=Raphidocelis subcapitata TaxID=307507 RepID=A0A2V0NP68_9CHLO|nr:ERD4-related membrane protein [Raphidocelis subcapitata]|eukprot:GBF87290.1 ERD4-related membrane protein [Raphidocelis subcapitata]